MPPVGTKADDLALVLEEAIVAGEIAPGTVLRQEQLSEQYGVSRTPVREAILRLDREGLVDVRPQQGTFVSRLDIAVIPEAVVIRQALEGATVVEAARVATDDDVALLDDIIAEQRFHRDRNALERFMNSDERFHEAIASIAKLPGVWNYLRPAKVHIDRARWLTVPFLGRATPVIGEHEVIRNTIAAHQPDAALSAMTLHLQAVFPDIASLRSQFSNYFV